MPCPIRFGPEPRMITAGFPSVRGRTSVSSSYDE